MAPLTQVCIALWVVQLFQTLVTVGLVRQFKSLQDSLNDRGMGRSELAVGSLAPSFSLQDVRLGRSAGLDPLRLKGQVLLFVSPSCSFCIDIVQNLHRIPDRALSRLVSVCMGFEADCRRLARRVPVGIPLLGDATRTVARQYGITTVPAVVVVTPLGKVRGYAHPASWEDVKSLLEDPSIDFEIGSSVGVNSVPSSARQYESEPVL